MDSEKVLEAIQEGILVFFFLINKEVSLVFEYWASMIVLFTSLSLIFYKMFPQVAALKVVFQSFDLP